MCLHSTIQPKIQKLHILQVYNLVAKAPIGKNWLSTKFTYNICKGDLLFISNLVLSTNKMAIGNFKVVVDLQITILKFLFLFLKIDSTCF